MLARSFLTERRPPAGNSLDFQRILAVSAIIVRIVLHWEKCFFTKNAILHNNTRQKKESGDFAAPGIALATTGHTHSGVRPRRLT